MENAKPHHKRVVRLFVFPPFPCLAVRGGNGNFAARNKNYPFIMKQFSTSSRVSTRRGLLAVSPLLLMVVLFLAMSFVTCSFYKVPLVVVFIIASSLSPRPTPFSSPTTPMPLAPRNPNSTAAYFPSPNA